MNKDQIPKVFLFLRIFSETPIKSCIVSNDHVVVVVAVSWTTERLWGRILLVPCVLFGLYDDVTNTPRMAAELRREQIKHRVYSAVVSLCREPEALEYKLECQNEPKMRFTLSNGCCLFLTRTSVCATRTVQARASRQLHLGEKEPYGKNTDGSQFWEHKARTAAPPLTRIGRPFSLAQKVNPGSGR